MQYQIMSENGFPKTETTTAETNRKKKGVIIKNYVFVMYVCFWKIKRERNKRVFFLRKCGLLFTYNSKHLLFENLQMLCFLQIFKL